MAGDDWAIVVGVSHYPDLGDLVAPDNDARAFFEWVTAETGGDVPSDHARLILSSHFPLPQSASAADARPNTRDVQAAFDQLDDIAQNQFAQAKGRRIGRRLYIYLAGRGFMPSPGECALLMAHATRQRAGYHIPGKLYASWFLQAGYFEEVILFMDCSRESLPLPPLNVPPYIETTDPAAASAGTLFCAWGVWHRRGVLTHALLIGPVRAKLSPAEKTCCNPIH
jgi:hypothetical protein